MQLKTPSSAKGEPHRLALFERLLTKQTVIPFVIIFSHFDTQQKAILTAPCKISLTQP
jgi:hypothetical protein